MDPVAVTSATLVAKWAAEGFVKEAAKSAWSGLQRLYEVIRSRIAGDENASETLQRLEAKPESEGRAIELAEVLSEYMGSNPDFRRELEAAIDEAGEAQSVGGFITTVRDNAKVGKITNIGTVQGDIHF